MRGITGNFLWCLVSTFIHQGGSLVHIGRQDEVMLILTYSNMGFLVHTHLKHLITSQTIW